MLITRFMTADGVGEVTDFMPIARARRPTGTGWSASSRWCAARCGSWPKSSPGSTTAAPPHKLERHQRRVRVHRRRPATDLYPTGEREVIPGGRTADWRWSGSAMTCGWTDPARGRDGGVVLESMGGRPRRVPPAELQQLTDDTAPVLAGLGAPVDLPGPVAGDGGPFGHDAEADDLRARPAPWSPRRPPGCPSRSAANATGTTATPGSATRRSPSTRCSASATPTRPRRSALAAATVPASTAATARPLKIMYRVDGALRPARGDPRSLRGLARLPAGPHRQRRRRPAPARHLRRGAGRRSASPTRSGLRLGHQGWTSVAELPTGCATTGTSPTRASGRPAAAARTSPTAGSSAGSPGPRDPPRRRARPPRRPRPRWTAERDPSTRQIMTRGWNPQAQAFVQHYDDRRARRLAADDAADGLRLADRPDVAVHPGRDGRASWSPTASSTGTTPAPPPTGCAARRARSPSARSGTWTRWPARDGWTRRGWSFEKMLTYANHLGLYSEEIGTDRRATRQLPAGVHPPGPDQRRDQPRRPARSRAGDVEPVAADRWCHTAQRSWLSGRPARAARFPPVPKMITRCWCF